MKRTILILKTKFLTIVIFLVTSASLTQAQEIHFGVKAGLNLTDMYGILSPGTSSVSSTSIVVGYHVGAIVDIGFSDHFSLAPEVLFSTAGTKENINFIINSTTGIPYLMTYTGTVSVNLGYLQIPIMLKYKMDNGLNFSVGPTIGMLLMSSYNGNETQKTVIYTNPVMTSSSASTPAGKLDSAVNKPDLGFAIGAGYQFDFGLGFGIRYIFGFSNIFKGGYSYPDYNDPYGRTITQGPYGQNETFQFSISYMFGTSR
jgi:hypothetical protein